MAKLIFVKGVDMNPCLLEKFIKLHLYGEFTGISKNSTLQIYQSLIIYGQQSLATILALWARTEYNLNETTQYL